MPLRVSVTAAAPSLTAMSGGALGSSAQVCGNTRAALTSNEGSEWNPTWARTKTLRSLPPFHQDSVMGNTRPRPATRCAPSSGENVLLSSLTSQSHAQGCRNRSWQFGAIGTATSTLVAITWFRWNWNGTGLLAG